MKRVTAFIIFFSLILFLVNCTKIDNNELVPNLPSISYDYGWQSLPSHIKIYIDRRTGNFSDSNPITNDGATLGRVLFYDRSLSLNNTISCASCHKQEIGFTDEKILSLGFLGGMTGRNSMSLLNIGFQFNGKMFWDERANSLEEQVLMPIHDKVEMGMDLKDLVLKLKAISYYKPLFIKAFGTSEITEDRIAKALSQFVRSIITYRSKYDKFIMGQSQLTALELTGKQIFEGRMPGGKLVAHDKTCIFCHSTELQLSTHGKADGDPINPNDKGIGAHTGLLEDIGRFKSPTLRNVSQSAPYLHNGSVPTIDSLLVFHANVNSDFTFSQGQYIAALKAFLETLTDHEITKDEKFSNPFR
ncbi:MAG: cytochrome-c peroxidase [Chitinophagales bacterium]|nr:cytochrome-c peroxidase [Sphingobacteriales bacterium]